MMRLSKSFTLNYFFSRLPNIERIPVRQLFINYVNKSKTQLTDINEIKELDEELQAKEEYIKNRQNKSKLFSADYNKQNDRMPYDQPLWEYHETLRYRRKMYGKYGEATKINPSILWPSYEEMNEMKEYESVAQPYSFQELVAKAKEKRRLEEEAKEAEKAAILAKVKNAKKEIFEFHKRVREKNEEAMKVIERKNRLIEEVRQHLGYNISVNDQKFKDMLAEFEKKQKMEMKKARSEKRAKRKELDEQKIKSKEDAISTSKEETEEI